MTDKQKHRPEDALTCLLYDAKQQHLLSGSVLPKVVCPNNAMLGTMTSTALLLPHCSDQELHQHGIQAVCSAVVILHGA